MKPSNYEEYNHFYYTKRFTTNLKLIQYNAVSKRKAREVKDFIIFKFFNKELFFKKHNLTTWERTTHHLKNEKAPFIF